MRGRHIRLLDSKKEIGRNCSTGVSLHCHTQQSKESLDFIPYYVSKIPVIANFLQRELAGYKSRNGEGIDFARAYWTPPPTPRTVLASEIDQIERELDLKAIVSITDHDDISASTHLRVLDSETEIPISFEWTVPFEKGFFHLGIHNLPAERAPDTWRQLNQYTLNPQPGRLSELMAMVHGFETALLVLNHPMWDIERIGEESHRNLLAQFVARHGRHIHAVEVNGYRSWKENGGAIDLAERFNYPLISGGDRHGYQANAIINLTKAASFAEFASEIRIDQASEVVILPEYKEPLALRMLETVADVLRYYPNYPKGQRLWTDRVFWRLDNESIRPLSSYWRGGGPPWVRASLSLMRIIGSRRLRPAMKAVLAWQEGVEL